MEDFLTKTSISGSGDTGGEDYNSTSFCVARTLEAANGTILSLPVLLSDRVFQILYGSFLVVFGMLLNGLVLFLVFKFKNLRNLSSAVAVQIAMADIAVIFTYSLPLVVNNIAGAWILGSEVCVASGFTLLMFFNLRNLLILSYSIDRFATIFFPFYYPKYSSKIITFLCGLAWLASTVISILNTPPILDCYLFSEPVLSCALSSQCSNSCNTFFTAYLATVVVPSSVVPAGLFIALYVKKPLQICKHTQRSVLRLTEQEWRALKTFFLMFLVNFLGTLLPSILFPISLSFGDKVHTFIVLLTSDFAAIVTITDPIIILRNADMRKSLRLTKDLLLHVIQERPEETATILRQDAELNSMEQ